MWKTRMLIKLTLILRLFNNNIYKKYLLRIWHLHYILTFYHKALTLFQQILTQHLWIWRRHWITLIVIPNICRALWMCQRCSESSLTRINSLHLRHNPMISALLISCYRWWNWHTGQITCLRLYGITRVPAVWLQSLRS